jgi:hypothetical protein
MTRVRGSIILDGGSVWPTPGGSTRATADKLRRQLLEAWRFPSQGGRRRRPRRTWAITMKRERAIPFDGIPPPPSRRLTQGNDAVSDRPMP